MTSCLLIKGPDRILAVADGRLSVSEKLVSFETTEKIRKVTPRYMIPKVAMQHFSHYIDYTERDWCLAYAGTYALASSIADLFTRVLGRGLFLKRSEGGVPQLAYDFDEGGGFDDSYNFDSDELPKISARVIKEELRHAAQVKCDEWFMRRRLRPDCEFLLFGQDAKTRKYAAFKTSVDPVGWSPGASVRLQIEEVADGAITCIGSVAVEAMVTADQPMRDGAEGWAVDQTNLSLGKLPDLDELIYAKPGSFDLEPSNDLDWGLTRMERRFVEILRATSDTSVGGDLTVASGSWYGGITLKRLRAA